jgi:hypothetical protein
MPSENVSSARIGQHFRLTSGISESPRVDDRVTSSSMPLKSVRAYELSFSGWHALTFLEALFQ